MKKHKIKMEVCGVRILEGNAVHLQLQCADGSPMPEMMPGQFVEVGVDKAHVLLNRPFSIFNRTDKMLELLVKPLGRASSALMDYRVGDTMEVIAPLGRGFDLCAPVHDVLLIGGGVGIAPMYYQARMLREHGKTVTIIYGERTAPDAELCRLLESVATLHICTDDGSAGFHGFVTQHPALLARKYQVVQVCGPMPMMKSLHGICRQMAIPAQFSLENKMACGLGACLCCVENTTSGHRCVCTDGPVFNSDELPW